MGTTANNWGLIGHEWAVDLLASRLASGRIGHAYLFTGSPGAGRRTLALRFAQALNCTGDAPPCGQCRACDLIARGAHPDVQVIAPEGRTLKIEQVRDLQHDLTLAPVEARYRVAILEDMQAATDQAADALLKTLEEPPGATRLLLTADSVDNVRPTIVSRCQVVPLRPVPARTLSAALVQRYGLPVEEANTLARLAAGRPGWAIAAAEDPAIVERHREVVGELLGLLRADRTGRFNASERIARDEALPFILETWQSVWRDVLHVVEDSSVLTVNADHQDELTALARDVSAEQARRALYAVRRTIAALEKYANTRLALDLMLLDLPYLQPQ